MNCAPPLFQITDRPKLRRAFLTVPLIVLGVQLSFFAALSGMAHRQYTLIDSAALSVGVLLLICGIAGWLLPLPAARAFVKVTPEGMLFCETSPPSVNTAYIAAPWSAIGSPVLAKEAASWEICIPVRLGESERIRYRNRYGGYALDTEGYVVFSAPVLTRRRGNEMLATLNTLYSRFAGAEGARS